MKNTERLILLLFVVIPFLLNAQVDNSLISNSCFTDQLHQTMLNENAHYTSKHQEIEQKIYNLNNSASFSSKTIMTTKTIPVVVHIVHQNGPENISDGQVFGAIQQLNEAFANIGFYEPDTGVDTEIEFCLAMRDPQNNTSNGINRIESALTNLTVETQDLDLKGLLQWNPLDYLNIWVVNEITSLSAGSGVAGYAYFPSSHGLPEDGIVIEANYMGSSPDDTKVLVHEAGHYLGLYHTFEGACSNDNCQTDGDRICDTPPDQSTAPVDCGANINTCNTDEDDTSANNPFRPVALGGLGDQNDMYINYMDYGHLPCYSAFTAGQKERMNSVLLMPRQSLLESYGCQAPCPLASFEASFFSNPPSPILASELVDFTNTSDPANFYEWSINNQVISNTLNSSYTFNQEGLFTVNLQIRDTINSCESSIEQIIEIICEGEASFSTTDTEILPGETLNFTNTSTGNTSYQWFLDGALYSSDTDLSITFTDPGYYSLYLVGATSSCLNYSSTITIIVGACIEDKSEMHWYFGQNAALDFNSGEPVNVSGSQLDVFEGSACISDDNGDLLFYTDGLSVWNAIDTVMPNGSGLMGGPTTSAWNQVLIIPRPYNPNQYYVFTCDEFENGMVNGIRYSIVDMTLNSGLGDITDVKNVFLCPGDTETMSAAYHDDGQKAWFVIPANGVLNSYLIDSTGIGPAIIFSDTDYDGRWGFAKFSNSGKKLISSHSDSEGFTTIVILDFDNVNGLFTNPIEIYTYGQIWSFDVSPDDSKLYVSLWEGEPNFHYLYQFDLSLTTAPQISNSKTLIGNLSSIDRLLLGPNGKMYNTVISEPYLGVVNNPNELGTACNYAPGSVNLSPASNFLSLPKFIRGQRRSEPSMPVVNLGPNQSICNGLTVVLDSGNENYDFLWQDGSTNATYTAWLPGTYWVTASNECGSTTDSINIELAPLNIVDLGDDMSLCGAEDIILDAGTLGDFYLWQDGSNNSTLVVTEPGVYSVEVSTMSGCYQGDSISVSLDTQAPIVDCPMNLDTIVSSGTSEVLLSPDVPDVTDNCSYTFVNDFTNTNDASANYPAGTTTLLTWTATDTNGNSTTCTMEVTVDVSTGIEDLNKESSSLILYPNPSNGLFILEETQNNRNDIQLSVFDALGRRVFEQSVFLQGEMRIDLSAQATGVYFLHWSTKENSGVFKLISEGH